MMAPLLFEEKHDENPEKTVDGVMICIKCGSPNTTILTKTNYCRDCRIFTIFRQIKSVKPFPKVEFSELLKMKPKDRICHRMIPNYMINEWVGKPKENIDHMIKYFEDLKLKQPIGRYDKKNLKNLLEIREIIFGDSVLPQFAYLAKGDPGVLTVR